jgi:hypothetical protein
MSFRAAPEGRVVEERATISATECEREGASSGVKKKEK